MPSSFAARITRMAISPRLATSRLLIRWVRGMVRSLGPCEDSKTGLPNRRGAGMKKVQGLLAGVALSLLGGVAMADKAAYGIAIHGGAGTLPRSEMTRKLEEKYLADLGQALDAGYAVLESGGSSEDATIAAVKVLEDSPLFNAGKGAVFNKA